jgi:hypothetical protein
VTPSEAPNNFLLDLLALQQDGRLAISAPTNWTTHEPLLEVETEVDAIIEELHESILVGGGNDTARWHFFVGSPGNGKSAAMGKLCRQLMFSKGCQVRDEAGVSITDLESTAIPYALNVYEGSNRFASAQIVQDASVVRNPFSADIDPAAELLDTLKNAWEKGISLVVCTNRGVLEKAHRDHHMNRDINSTPWFKVVTAVVSTNNSLAGEIGNIREFEGKKPVFRWVKVEYSHLDNRSLLLGRDTFAHLVQRATAGSNWTSCASCSVQGMCPFKANRDWLAEGNACSPVLRLLTRAEVLSGQVIVFREALAIISLVLAGCPRDYDSMHPCDWVRAKVASNDIFSLATRRLYMSLFASYSPYGLEVDNKLLRQQLEAFRGLCEAIGESNPRAHAAIRRVVESHPPSTDVGVTRLLGENGIIASLDPCREALPSEFYDRWDSDFDAVPIGDSPCFTEIELNCLLIWKEMEESLELASDHSVPECYWALRRWSSNFLLHFGALIEGRTAWSEELDMFADLLSLVAKPLHERSIDDKRTIRQLDTQLESLLNVATGDQPGSTIPLSEAVTLVGRWVREKMKPKTVASEASGSVSLAIQFEGGERAVFAAPMYLWLTRRAEGKLDARCFPRELISGVADARVRAAAKGKYAFEDDDVELVIDTGTGEQFRLARFDGDVDVTH